MRMDINRRELLRLATLPTLPAAASLANALSAVHAQRTGDAQAVPWSRKVRRVGQLNMTEHDPVALDVEAWADYWASLKVDVVLVSVTGILAFYQTTVPFHKKGRYLGERDFFGDCCAAAKKRGLRVIARMSPDLNWEEAVQAHPEWFQRNAQGEAVHHTEDARLFRTCMFSSYMTDYMPAIMKEVNALYDVDGLFTNAWPPLGSLPVCHCEQCRKLPAPGTVAYWDRFNERTMFLWKLYDSIAKEKSPSNFFFANLGGGVRSTANLVELGKVCEWFQCDNQGRGGDDTPIWGCALQGRVCNAVQSGKMATNVTGAWSTGAVRWRNIHKSPEETRMWMNETLASGMVPYHHIIGGETGLGEDRRGLEPARQYFNWMAKHEPHFVNRRSIASIGVVMGQRTQLFHAPPRGTVMQQYVDGLYYALLEGRFLFDFVHEEKLSPGDLSKYSALILPNVALLSDEQCRQLAAFAAAGGSLLATFQTSLYTERNEPRADFGLAEVFGIRKAGSVVGTTGNGYMARIERRHDILDGVTGTALLPGAENRVPVAPVESPVLTVVPGYVAYPPELSYPDPSRTNEPAVVVREKGQSRLVYFPGDVERTMWRSGHTDLSKLLRNSIRWVAGPNAAVTIQGDGVIEAFAWETAAGFAVHVLNYTNPAMHRGWLRAFYPIGAQQVGLTLPPNRKVTRVELLRAETDVRFQVEGGAVSFTIPSVTDYEVAAIYSA
jgi:Hypothetical glycosyl hydrolase 6/Beta-galactosidase trimerisation domain